jgi:coenzyme F420 hydrogenase subunit beta
VEAFKNQDYINSTRLNPDFLFGPSSFSCYCCSGNKDIRFNSSSGGIIKTIIQESVIRNSFSAIACVVENPLNSMRPYFKLVSSVGDINNIANSKYSPVALNGILKQIISNNDLKKILFVGLPCHIRGIKRAFKTIPELKSKEVVTIGLFCKKTKDIRYSRFVCNRLIPRNIKYSSVQNIKFRGAGWPGELSVKVNDLQFKGSYLSGAFGSFPWKWWLFSPESCLFCYDSFSRESDLSVGDPWLERFYARSIKEEGGSFVVVRTHAGEQLLKEFNSLIVSEPVENHDVYDPNSEVETKDKLFNASARLDFLKLVIKEGEILPSNRFTILSVLNAIWFFKTKRLFEVIFSCSFMARANVFIFHVLNLFPTSLFTSKNKKPLE